MTAADIPSHCCAFCGLPVAQSWWVKEDSAAAESFCCYGCRFAAAVTQSRGESGHVNSTLVRLGLAIFFTMNVMVFTMALWSQDFYGVHGTSDSPHAQGLHGLFGFLSLLFALPVMLLLGGPLLESAWDDLLCGRWTTDLLLLLGVGASYLYSALAVVREDGRVYFEVVCVVLVLVTLGRWLEANGKLKATEAIESLQQLLPNQVRLIRAGQETLIAPKEVGIGDCLRVCAGERIPCDGTVLNHPATVDEQILTGESRPVVKEPNDPVFGGSLNLDCDLQLQVTATADAGTLARMIELVRNSFHAKGRYERLADRIAAIFLPTVVVIAVLTFAFHAHAHDWESGILNALAVLLIACPCALGIATPMAVWTALGEAARRQVLFRNGEALEKLASVRAVRFDKTGTLTTGLPAIAEFALHDPVDREETLRQTRCLAATSQHSYSAALRRFAESQFASVNVSSPTALMETRTLPGRGLWARPSPDSHAIYFGSLRWMEESKLKSSNVLAERIKWNLAEGRPLTCIGWRGEVRGMFAFEEQLRPEAFSALKALKEQGLDVGVLTGDHATRGQVLSRQLGVSVQAGLLPEDKVAAIIQVQQTVGAVAMVGDGINDAPALAQSDVGMALGCGADISRASAAVCLLANDLSRVPWCIDLAHRTVRIIRQNLFWAFFYNVLGIGLACTGNLSPVWASAAMILSSIFVVANSLRLKHKEPACLPGF